MRRPSRARVVRALPHWLVEKVPRDHRESDAAFARRRKVVAGSTLAGAGLLGLSLSSRPGSNEFYALTAAVAGTWVAGGFTSGPLHLGWMQDRDATLRRPVATPVLTGVAAFGAFYACALVARRIPVLDEAIGSVLAYAAIGEQHPVALSTAAYALSTVTTRNPALVLAATVMGTLFAAQRRASGGIQASVLTHVTWSTLMLRYLPPLFRDRHVPGG